MARILFAGCALCGMVQRLALFASVLKIRQLVNRAKNNYFAALVLNFADLVLADFGAKLHSDRVVALAGIFFVKRNKLCFGIRGENAPSEAEGKNYATKALVIRNIPFQCSPELRYSRKSLLREDLLSLAEQVLYHLQQASSAIKIEEARPTGRSTPSACIQWDLAYPGLRPGPHVGTYRRRTLGTGDEP